MYCFIVTSAIIGITITTVATVFTLSSVSTGTTGTSVTKYATVPTVAVSSGLFSEKVSRSFLL